MSNLSDIIENFIIRMISKAEEDYLEIQRNELANYFGCAPSQINYVLSTRFTLDKGYYIESRRGGGGCIRIVKIDFDNNEYITEIINKLSEGLSKTQFKNLIGTMLYRGIVTEREARIIQAVLETKTYGQNNVLEKQFTSDLMRSILTQLLR